MKQKKKEFSLKEIEAALEELKAKGDWYPKDLGNGLYEIAPGCISGKRGLELLDEEIRKSLASDHDELMKDFKGIDVVDVNRFNTILPNGVEITFKEEE